MAFIKNSLSPAEIGQVVLNEKDKSAQVVVKDSQLSLAIGKKGQNVRLTAKLTCWRIDITKEADYMAQEKSKIDKIFASQPDETVPAGELTEKLGAKLAAKLVQAKVVTVAEILELGLTGLQNIDGIGPKTAEKILAAVQ